MKKEVVWSQILSAMKLENENWWVAGGTVAHAQIPSRKFQQKRQVFFCCKIIIFLRKYECIVWKMRFFNHGCNDLEIQTSMNGKTFETRRNYTNLPHHKTKELV